MLSVECDDSSHPYLFLVRSVGLQLAQVLLRQDRPIAGQDSFLYSWDGQLEVGQEDGWGRRRNKSRRRRRVDRLMYSTQNVLRGSEYALTDVVSFLWVHYGRLLISGGTWAWGRCESVRCEE